MPLHAVLVVGLAAAVTAKRPAFDQHQSFCFARSYSSESLRGSPHQKITDIAVSYQSIIAGKQSWMADDKGAVSLPLAIRAVLRDRAGPFEATADCRVQGQTLDCSVDNDGGRFLLTLAGALATLVVPSAVTLAPLGTDEESRPESTRYAYVLARDDQSRFALSRATGGLCQPR